MSNRSRFEINHDYAHEIARDPEGFAELLSRFLGSMVSADEDDLRLRFGVKYEVTRHHSEEWFEPTP